MKAIRVHEFGDAEVMQHEDVPEPTAAAGEVVLNVEAIGVNPVDTYVRAGVHLIKPELPFIPGADAAGTVLSLGDGVSQFKAGDRVYVADGWGGCYAEQVTRRADHIFPLPDNVSFAQGAAISTPLWHRLLGLGESRPRQGGGNRVGTWRQRRRRHCRSADRQQYGHQHHRHGR